MERRSLEDLRDAALQMLRDDDDLFVECVNELDCWNGFADGYRCYDMSELDELFGEMRVSEFLDKLCASFNVRDAYMVDTIYGIDSTDYPAEVYRDNTSESEVLDEVIECWNHLYIGDGEFCELIEQIVNYDEDEEDEE